MATKVTQRLDEQRNSPEMQAFKEKVNALLAFANAPEIEYYMVRDLAKKQICHFTKKQTAEERE